MDGRPVWNSPGVRLGDWPVHSRFSPLRDIDEHTPAGALPGAAGVRRSNDGTRRATDPGTSVRKIGARSHHERRRDPSLDWADAWTNRRRPRREVSSLALYLFPEHPNWYSRAGSGLSSSAGLQGKAD